MEKNNFEGDKTHILADNYIKKSKRNLKFKSHNPNRNKKKEETQVYGPNLDYNELFGRFTLNYV